MEQSERLFVSEKVLQTPYFILKYEVLPQHWNCISLETQPHGSRDLMVQDSHCSDSGTLNQCSSPVKSVNQYISIAVYQYTVGPTHRNVHLFVNSVLNSTSCDQCSTNSLDRPMWFKPMV